jgi:hypothetical protein
MGLGYELRQAFEAMVQMAGQTIVIHFDFNTPQARTVEARGLKNSPSKNSRQVIFQFPEPLEIPVGSVLQVKGSRDYWKVTDTEDIVHDDEFTNFEVHVQKINVEGKLTRPPLTGGPTYNLHGPHSRVNIQSQDHSVNISSQITENVFADLRQAIQASIEDTEEQTEILSRLEELESAKGTSSFVQKYQNFIASAAKHIDLIAPFIPALTQMIGA